MATSQDIANKANEATLKRMPITFVQRLKKSAPVILTVSIVMLILEYLGFLHGLEFVGRDLFLALQKPKQLQYVRIVGIDEDDYRTYFGNHLPLRPDRVQRLIQAVATANPRVIGIDIDTSSWKEKDIWTEEQLLPVTSKKPKLIWAADAIFTDKRRTIPT